MRAGRLAASLLSAALLLVGCAQPRALTSDEINADPAIARAVLHVLPLFATASITPDGELEGTIASVILLPNGRGLTAAHSAVGKGFLHASDPEASTIRLTVDGEPRAYTMSALGLIGSRSREIVVADEGDAENHALDWALLEIDWEGMPEGAPVTELDTPTPGETVYLVGYPSRYLPDGWDAGMPRPDWPTPEDSGWLYPPATVLAGRALPHHDRWGLQVELPGVGSLDLFGLSGGAAFVRNDDRMALVGVVSRSKWNPLSRTVVLAPVPNQAREAIESP
ncbi:MAG: hypothetical protein ACF8Q5_10560 [Phycisphaerales bacterium JB040]